MPIREVHVRPHSLQLNVLLVVFAIFFTSSAIDSFVNALSFEPLQGSVAETAPLHSV